MVPGVSDWGMAGAVQRNEPQTDDHGQVSRGLADGDHVRGAPGEHDRAVDSVEPGREVGEDAPPQHLPEGVRLGEPRPAGRGPRSRWTVMASSAAPASIAERPMVVRAAAGRSGRRARRASRFVLISAPWWSRSPGAFSPEGEIATIDRARPRTANSSATRAPMELPSTCTRPTPSSSESVETASAIAAIVGRRGSAVERPCPGRSGASTRYCASSRGRNATKSSCVLPIPCSRSRVSPDPAQSQESSQLIRAAIERGLVGERSPTASHDGADRPTQYDRDSMMRSGTPIGPWALDRSMGLDTSR